jgi:hypothetical protein
MQLYLLPQMHMVTHLASPAQYTVMFRMNFINLLVALSRCTLTITARTVQESFSGTSTCSEKRTSDRGPHTPGFQTLSKAAVLLIKVLIKACVQADTPPAKKYPQITGNSFRLGGFGLLICGVSSR